MERYRIVFSGSGGQGVITASIILAEAAVLHEGLNAVQSQSYGPEARGGATRADVIISDQAIHFPKANQPNILICLTQMAYNQFSSTIRPGGLLLTDSHFVTQERKVDARQVELGMYEAVLDKIGKPVVFNICVLGVLLNLVPMVKYESVVEVLKASAPEEFLDMNKTALELGKETAEQASVGDISLF